jgi:periplasmic divalent cation tolerance protein
MAELDVVIVLTTLPMTADATDVARALVHERLAACVTVLGESQATYRWKDDVCEDRERPLLIKTVRDRLPALEARLRVLHPYEVPEFLVLPVAEGAGTYLAWVRDCTRLVS